MAPTIICAIEATTVETVTPSGGALASALGGRVMLAHVRRDPVRFSSPTDRERALHGSRRRGHALLRRARGLLPTDVDAEERFEFGPVADELAALADDAEPAIIVAGSRRHGAIAAALLGSVSRTLASEAPCPVLIVSGAAPAQLRRDREGSGDSPSTIAGVDGTERSVSATSLAREIADRLGDRLLLVHAEETASVISGPRRPGWRGRVDSSLLTEALARAGVEPTLVVESGGPPADALRRVCERENARLIVIGAGRDGGLRSLLEPSVADRLPSLAPCPVLVVPEQASATLGPAPVVRDRRAA